MARQLTKLGALDVKRTLFLLCDLQEKFRPSMKYFDPLVKNTNKLVTAGKVLDIPLLVTEQYPEKLGHTVKDIDIQHAQGVYAKTLFSMAIPEVKTKITEMFGNDLETIVLFGIESHICVEQTAIDLISLGYTVHIPADCAMSRSLDDRNLALDRLRQIGCFITSSENVIFKLLKDKNHPGFDKVRKFITQVSEDTGLSKL